MKVTGTSEYKEDFDIKAQSVRRIRTRRGQGQHHGHFMKPEPMWPRTGKHV